MKAKNLKISGIIISCLVIIVSLVYAVNIQPAVTGEYNIDHLPSHIPDSESHYSGLLSFFSYKEFTNFLNNFTSTRLSYSQVGVGGFGGSKLVAPLIAEDIEFEVVSWDSDEESIDYSNTNIQVEGVDEPDIVKTDGKYLYIVSNNKIYIVKATPAENAVIECEITLNNSLSVQNIFINENRLVVFAQNYDYPIYDEHILVDDDVDVYIATTSMPIRWYSSPDTNIIIYDLSDINNPEISKEVVVPGNFEAARMIGDYVYLITTQYSYNIYNQQGNNTIVPQIMIDGEVHDVPISNIKYVEIPETSRTITNIVSVNVHDESEEVTAKIYLIGNSQVLYVSNNNIYITYSVRNYNYDILSELIEEIINPYLNGSFKEEIDLIKNMKNLNENQKKTVIEWILQNFTKSISEELKLELYREINKLYERTTIHRIQIEDGGIEYKSQGSVPGNIDNQFSLSEHDGHLRVSTTLQGRNIQGFFSSRMQSENNVYILDMDLNIKGAVEGLAPGETIYATRFLGDKCYLVTFRQVDPFFVIDLSDPTNPELLGKLKIPGYSTYLHPYDDKHIIGIGMEGRKVKISFFDVTNLSNPIELSKYIIENNNGNNWGWGDSYALYEHKAFLFEKEKNLLIIPAGKYNKQSAYVFDITIQDGIKLKGNITHENKDQEQYEDDYYWYDYGYSIKRTLYIENTLYTISDKMVKMNSLDDLSELNSIDLT